MIRIAAVKKDGYAEFVWTKWVCPLYPVFLTVELGYYPDGWEFMLWPALNLIVVWHMVTALRFMWCIGPVSIKMSVRRYRWRKAK